MAQTAIGGWGAYLNYGFEATFGAGAVSAREFGYGQKILISRRNNQERIFALGARNAQTSVAKKYEGMGTISFNMSNGSFWRAVLGAVADTPGTPVTHTYTETNVLPTFAIDTGSELGTTDEVVELKGCVVKTCTLTSAVDELVKVSLDFMYSDESLATSGIGSQVAPHADSYPFTFASGTLEIPDGSTIAFVQSFELTIDNSDEMIWGLGSRFGVTQAAKTRKYDIRMTVVYTDPTIFLQKFYGKTTDPKDTTQTPQATLHLTFTNGESSSNQRSIEINLTNVYFDTYDMNKDVEEVLKEDLSGHALACTNVIWSNNTGVDAGNP